ncbi:hypothetical protein GCM10010341_18460 [Streptomyces noursei]|nr:hypothetical protein GCM10010341_18460 [Streptomyces noursei]
MSSVIVLTRLPATSDIDRIFMAALYPPARHPTTAPHSGGPRLEERGGREIRSAEGHFK